MRLNDRRNKNDGRNEALQKQYARQPLHTKQAEADRDIAAGSADRKSTIDDDPWQ